MEAVADIAYVAFVFSLLAIMIALLKQPKPGPKGEPGWPGPQGPQGPPGMKSLIDYDKLVADVKRGIELSVGIPITRDDALAVLQDEVEEFLEGELRNGRMDK
jgi:hypothetical protein